MDRFRITSEQKRGATRERAHLDAFSDNRRMFYQMMNQFGLACAARSRYK
jgi:hypothetical protein